MNDEQILAKLNAQWPNSVTTLDGHGQRYDQENKTLEMSFTAIDAFCHSGNIVQGGYITGMLDAAMAYAMIGWPDACDGVATLEIKVNFMTPGHPGKMNAIGRIVHHGRSIAYLDAELRQEGRLIATANSTVKLVRAKANGQ